MILKHALTVSVLSVVASSTAFAHSEYWHCAVEAGSAERVEAHCGSRSDWERTGDLGGERAPTAAERAERERREEDERRREEDRRRDEERRRDDDRREEERRRDEDRRREDDRRREREEEESRHSRDTWTPPREERRPRREEPVYAEDFQLQVNINAAMPSVNVGVAANLDAYQGYRIKNVEVVMVTSGNSKVHVYSAGKRIGGINAQQPGEYAKEFRPGTRISRAQKNLTLTTEGDVTLSYVIITIGR